MNPKRILLTGDDSYHGTGLRVLINFLKAKYDLNIAATFTQQSGVGGGFTMEKVKEWGESEVDGVSAVWVKSTPADVMEFAQGYFLEKGLKFDLVISGINWGPNIGYALNSSGTYGAAIRAIAVGLAPKAIVMSLDRPVEDWNKNHEGEKAEDYFEYPGNAAEMIFNLCLENDNWGKSVVNVNFPAKSTMDYKMTKLSTDVTKFFKYPVNIDWEKKTFTYPEQWMADEAGREQDPEIDTGALNNGLISVTPMGMV
jgi:5'-nucleotidase